ncbi:MAG: GxxExxY protein [Vicinamibacterales bacterium]
MFDSPPSLQDPRTFAIIGAAYEVHRLLGTGFLEIFYKDALEIKARSVIGPADHAQVLNYLASSVSELACS